MTNIFDFCRRLWLFSLKHCTKGQYLSFYSKLALNWSRMTRPNCMLWRLQQTWEADRKAWGRQRDETSTSRLMGNWWFVVFTKPVWVWLTRTRTGSRQKTSRLTGLFSFLTLFFFFFQGFEFVSSGAVPFRICLCAGSALCRVGLLLHQCPASLLNFSDFDV